MNARQQCNNMFSFHNSNIFYRSTSVNRKQPTSSEPAIMRVSKFGRDEMRAGAAEFFRHILCPNTTDGCDEGNTKLLAHVHINPSATTSKDAHGKVEGSIFLVSVGLVRSVELVRTLQKNGALKCCRQCCCSLQCEG